MSEQNRPLIPITMTVVGSSPNSGIGRAGWAIVLRQGERMSVLSGMTDEPMTGPVVTVQAVLHGLNHLLAIWSGEKATITGQIKARNPKRFDLTIQMADEHVLNELSGHRQAMDAGFNEIVTMCQGLGHVSFQLAEDEDATVACNQADMKRIAAQPLTSMEEAAPKAKARGRKKKAVADV